LRGYNWFTQNTLENFSRSFGGDPRSADNDVFNGSFGGDSTTNGLSYHLLPSFDNSRTTVLNNATMLRGGRGATVVFSSGNNFNQNGIPGACASAVEIGVTCGLPASSSFKQSIVPIIVGALAADGRKASYSNTASSIWVTAPGGEFGNEASIIGAGGSPNDYKPAITTVNLSGCGNYSSRWNALDNLGSNALAASCQYTAAMNGTSSAAPMVAGVVALMLEANPNLTYRDVAHILAVTARKVDPTFSGVKRVLVDAERTLEGGWTTNAAGYSFSNRYGFGAVDASAAVATARTFSGYLPAIQLVEASPFQAAGDTSFGSNGKFVAFSVGSTVTKVERAFVAVNIDNRNGGANGAICTQVELVSPAGTRSVLLNAANGFANAKLEDVLFSSNAFYGENPNGTWRLVAYDWCSSAPVTPTRFSLSKPQYFGFTGH
jgi:hypothetical protein